MSLLPLINQLEPQISFRLPLLQPHVGRFWIFRTNGAPVIQVRGPVALGWGCEACEGVVLSSFVSGLEGCGKPEGYSSFESNRATGFQDSVASCY